MKKGMLAKSLFLVGIFMLCFVLGCGEVLAGIVNEVFPYGGLYYHRNYWVSGSCSGSYAGSWACDSGYFCGNLLTVAGCYKQYKGGTVLFGGWSGFDGNYKCYSGQTIVGRKNAFVAGEGVFYKWDTVTSCSGTTASHCHDGYSSCQCDAVACTWNGWSSWSNVGSCGSYQACKQRQDRSRTSNAAACGGSACSGPSTETQYLDCGAVNGGWSSFGSWYDTSGWSTCSSCSQFKNQRKDRTCTNPSPACGGSACSGPSYENKSISQACGTVNGGWTTTWVNSGTCGQDQSCKQKQTKTCTNPSPACGGSACSGSSEQYVNCGTVNGGWSDWSSWSNVGSCGSFQACKQKQDHSKTCTNPSPACGGSACSGPSTETQYLDCGAVNGGWSSCSNSCGSGTKTCTNPSPACGGSACSGINSCTDYSGCTYSWQANVSWSSCNSASECGAGTQTRNVWCQRSDGTIVADNYCSGTKPATSQICTKLCDSGTCQNNVCVGITTAYWADTTAKPISTLGVNKTVLMIVNGTNLADNYINYSVYKDINFIFFSILKKVDSISGTGISTTTFTDVGRYKFIAKIQGIQEEKESGLLEILDVGLDNNPSPVAIIIFPAGEINTTIETNINFNQASYDEDDLLKITWNFGDGTTQTITNYMNCSGTVCSALNGSFNLTANVVHNYKVAGPYVVTLTAEEETGNEHKTSSTSRTINVFSSGVNVFPVISSPVGGVVYENRTINFDASNSYVVNCSTHCPSCPLKINNGKLNCYYLHPSSGARSYNLNLEWTIEPDSNLNFPEGKWFDSSGNVNTSVTDFYYYFFNPRERTVKLVMNYVTGS